MLEMVRRGNTWAPGLFQWTFIIAQLFAERKLNAESTFHMVGTDVAF